MPPTTKPQVKKKEAEEGKAGKKAMKAVAAALLLLLLTAVFVEAQQNTVARGNATKVVGEIRDWSIGGLDLVVLFFGSMFWVAVGIIVFHIAVAYLAPTRFQRLGAMWDAVERAKDVAIALGVLFALFYGILAAASVISGNFSTEHAFRLFVAIVSKPLVELYNQIIGKLMPAGATPSPGTTPPG